MITVTSQAIATCLKESYSQPTLLPTQSIPHEIPLQRITCYARYLVSCSL